MKIATLSAAALPVFAAAGPVAQQQAPSAAPPQMVSVMENLVCTAHFTDAPPRHIASHTATVSETLTHGKTTIVSTPVITLAPLTVGVTSTKLLYTGTAETVKLTPTHYRNGTVTDKIPDHSSTIYKTRTLTSHVTELATAPAKEQVKTSKGFVPAISALPVAPFSSSAAPSHAVTHGSASSITSGRTSIVASGSASAHASVSASAHASANNVKRHGHDAANKKSYVFSQECTLYLETTVPKTITKKASTTLTTQTTHTHNDHTTVTANFPTITLTEPAITVNKTTTRTIAPHDHVFTSTKTVTNHATSTAAIEKYQACFAPNQLDHTFKTNASTEITNYTPVAIRSFMPNNQLNVVKPHSVANAYECCAACVEAKNCAGSIYDGPGSCMLFVTKDKSCPKYQRLFAGEFFAEAKHGAQTLGMSDVAVVSNGLCGRWVDGDDIDRV